MNEDKVKKLKAMTNDAEMAFNKKLPAIMEEFGLDGCMSAFVNVGAGLIAKALVMTAEDHRGHMLMTIDSLIESKMKEGDAEIEAQIGIAKAMGSTCRPH